MAIYRGCYWSKIGQVKNRSDGQPVDISTWQFEANLKDGTDATVLAMSSAGSHFTVTDGDDGLFRISMTTAQTQALAAGPVTAAIYRTDAVEGRTRIARFTEQVREQD
jgi:hypothetical protein